MMNVGLQNLSDLLVKCVTELRFGAPAVSRRVKAGNTAVSHEHDVLRPVRVD